MDVNLLVKMKKGVVLAAVVLHLAGFVGTITSARAAEEATPQQLLSRAIQATAWRARSHVEARYHSVVQHSPNEVRESRGRTEVFIDGPSRRLLHFADDDTRLLDILVHDNRRIALIGEVATYSDDPHWLEMTSGFDASPSPVFGAFLEGVYVFKKWGPPLDLARALAEGKMDDAIGLEQIGDLTCHVVTVHGDTWSWKLWIAPERGYNLVRQEIRREVAPGERSVQTVDQTEFEFMEPVGWVAKRGRITGITTWAGGESQTRVEVDRTKVSLPPDFAALKAFQPPPIADGTPVVIQEANPDMSDVVSDPIRHVWKDGQPVLDYDPQTVERIRRRVEEVKRERDRPPQR